MVVKITQRPVAATSAVSATADEPVDAFHSASTRSSNTFERSRRHRSGSGVGERLPGPPGRLPTRIEREANRLEANDRRQVPAKVRYRKETYRVNKKTPARIASRFGTITLHSFYYLNVEDGEPGLHP